MAFPIKKTSISMAGGFFSSHIPAPHGPSTSEGRKRVTWAPPHEKPCAVWPPARIVEWDSYMGESYQIGIFLCRFKWLQYGCNMMIIVFWLVMGYLWDRMGWYGIIDDHLCIALHQINIVTLKGSIFTRKSSSNPRLMAGSNCWFGGRLTCCSNRKVMGWLWIGWVISAVWVWVCECAMFMFFLVEYMNIVR